MLKVKKLAAFYGKSQALFDVNFEMNKGEVLVMLGRNGMGKSTTIQAVMGMIAHKKGTISFLNQDITKLNSYQIAQLGLGYVPEGRRVFPNLSVRENLLATAKGSGWNETQIYELFPSLKNRINQYGKSLSGGEQQMLSIARALMTNPSLLILDEATEGLAPVIRQQIWETITILKEKKLSILIVDKNLKDLFKIADQCIILEKGSTKWKGSPKEIQSDTELQAKLLGV